MTCADCGSPAEWTYRSAGALAVDYCDRHVPSYLRGSAGLSPVPPPAVEPEPEPAPRKKKIVLEASVEDPENPD